MTDLWEFARAMVGEGKEASNGRVIKRVSGFVFGPGTVPHCLVIAEDPDGEDGEMVHQFAVWSCCIRPGSETAGGEHTILYEQGDYCSTWAEAYEVYIERREALRFEV